MHYANGLEAKLGDLVRGKGYNIARMSEQTKLFLKAVLLGIVLSFPGLGCVSAKRYQRDIQLQNANNDALIELAHVTVLRLHALEERFNSLVLSESK